MRVRESEREREREREREERKRETAKNDNFAWEIGNLLYKKKR